MKLVLIPAGEFLMGSPTTKDRWESDEHQHRVRITKPFYLGIYAVTQEQYEQAVGANPSRFKGSQHPVEEVNWNDAVKFCDKLSSLPEEKAAGRTYHLPTEAEWEYACRAGSTTRYSFGDDPADLGDHAWFKGNSSVITHPWARNPMLGASTTCTGMCGSGVRIGGILVTIKALRSTIPQGLLRARSG